MNKITDQNDHKIKVRCVHSHKEYELLEFNKDEPDHIFIKALDGDLLGWVKKGSYEVVDGNWRDVERYFSGAEPDKKKDEIKQYKKDIIRSEGEGFGTIAQGYRKAV